MRESDDVGIPSVLVVVVWVREGCEYEIVCVEVLGIPVEDTCHCLTLVPVVGTMVVLVSVWVPCVRAMLVELFVRVVLGL